MAWDKAHIDTELDREVRELLSAAERDAPYRTDGGAGAAAEDCAVYRTAAAEHT